MAPLIDLESAREIFTHRLPPWLDFLDELEAQGGQLQFKPELGHYLKANHLESYPLLYQRLPLLLGNARLAIERSVGADLVLPGTDISLATAQDRGRLMIEVLGDLDELDP